MGYEVKQKVHVLVSETSALGGGKHRGVIENIVPDMYDNTPLYLVKVKGDIIAVKEAALVSYKTKKKQ